MMYSLATAWFMINLVSVALASVGAIRVINQDAGVLSVLISIVWYIGAVAWRNVKEREVSNGENCHE